MWRKAFFQVHLWTGIIVGLYVVLICLTGCVLVFRIEFYDYFRPGTTVTPKGERLPNDAIEASAKRAYPDFTVTRVAVRRRNPRASADVWLEQPGGRRLHRLFDPYTGADLGDADPAAARVFEWISDLHDNLLGGRTGRTVNGVGALCLTVMCLSGVVVWWPGARKLWRGMTVRRHVNWKRFTWDLHSALGFWSFVMIFMWAVTGVYLVFPTPFQALADRFQSDVPIGTVRSGDAFLAWFSDLHFGRFAGLKMRIAWGLAGLTPPILFVTGAIMWWNRVVRRRWIGGDS